MISVVVSTYNSEKYIKTCVDAVLKSRRVDYEIIRIDCGTRALGLTVTHNMGARLALGEYLLFLDVDTKIDKKALFEIVNFFENNKDVGAIQAKLIDKDGNIEATGHFLSVFGFPYEVKKRKEGFIFGARTACLAIRKSVFEKVGGFDGDYFMHGEETDLSWRVWLAGYRIYYLPRAEVEHYGKSHYLSEIAKNRLFYEGAKNQITTILKNADLSIILWMLPLNIIAWTVVGLKSVWVYRGIGRAILDIKKTLIKRKKVLRVKNNEAKKFMFGNISFIELLKKGFLWAKSI